MGQGREGNMGGMITCKGLLKQSYGNLQVYFRIKYINLIY